MIITFYYDVRIFIFFHFQICEVCGWVIIYKRTSKFGYRLERKTENFRNHVIFL